MFIHILRTGNHYDYVKDFMLDRLIESNEVVKFKRSTGWVTIGTDPIRGIKREGGINGTDRRAVYSPVVIRKYIRAIGDQGALFQQAPARAEE